MDQLTAHLLGERSQQARERDFLHVLTWGGVEKLANGDEEEEGKATGKTPSTNQVVAFLRANPNPTDDDFHDWCEEHGFDVHKAEEVTYRIASASVKTAGVMTEGLSKGRLPKDLDPAELRKGIKVEMEHTKNKALSAKIAVDHLHEDPKYYTALDKMEERRKKEMGKTAMCGRPHDKTRGQLKKRAEITKTSGLGKKLLYGAGALGIGAGAGSIGHTLGRKKGQKEGRAEGYAKGRRRGEEDLARFVTGLRAGQLLSKRGSVEKRAVGMIPVIAGGAALGAGIAGGTHLMSLRRGSKERTYGEIAAQRDLDEARERKPDSFLGKYHQATARLSRDAARAAGEHPVGSTLAAAGMGALTGGALLGLGKKLVGR